MTLSSRPTPTDPQAPKLHMSNQLDCVEITFTNGPTDGRKIVIGTSSPYQAQVIVDLVNAVVRGLDR